MIKIAQIRLLKAIADEGTLIGAAQRLHCVPSNITARLRDLEDIVGKALVQRETGQYVLTPTGRLLLTHGMHLLQEADRIDGLIRSGQPYGELTVAALDVALQRFIPAALPIFLERFPNVRLKLLCRSSLTIEEMVATGKADIGLTDGPIVHPQFDSQFAFTERLFLVAPAGFDLKQKSTLTGLTAFTFDTDCFYNTLFNDWLKKQKLVPIRHVVVESYAAMFHCVAQGKGIACVPECFIPSEGCTNLTFHEVKGLGPTSVFFLLRKSSPDDLIDRFIETMQTQ